MRLGVIISRPLPSLLRYARNDGKRRQLNSSAVSVGEDMFHRLFPAFAALIVCTSFALAGELSGVWLHEDGASKVRFAPCGAALCGTIVWLRDKAAQAKVGQRVFYEMIPSGDNAWTGKAFEPASGKEYSGKMSLSGDKLTTAGCVFGGLICKSIVWSRAP
jgi:uncharacterized protein (DUF2147 family)